MTSTASEIEKNSGTHVSPFERIRRTNEAGNEFWSSRDLADVLEYTQYRNFEAVIEKAKLSCFNSGHRIEDHFADVGKMVEIGSSAVREIKETMLFRYACYCSVSELELIMFLNHEVVRSLSRGLVRRACESEPTPGPLPRYLEPIDRFDRLFGSSL